MSRRERPELQEREYELEMTPMIDVTFLLLIFFLCTIKFKTLEGKLAAYLPKDAGPAVHDTATVEPLALRIEVDGVGPARALRYEVGALRTRSLSEVQARLDHLAASDPERRVALYPGDGVLHGEVVRVLDATLRAGFGQISFAGLGGS